MSDVQKKSTEKIQVNWNGKKEEGKKITGTHKTIQRKTNLFKFRSTDWHKTALRQLNVAKLVEQKKKSGNQVKSNDSSNNPQKWLNTEQRGQKIISPLTLIANWEVVEQNAIKTDG